VTVGSATYICSTRLINIGVGGLSSPDDGFRQLHARLHHRQGVTGCFRSIWHLGI
jgi:hypothetical protein